jgi:hypothetical protein
MRGPAVAIGGRVPCRRWPSPCRAAFQLLRHAAGRRMPGRDRTSGLIARAASFESLHGGSWRRVLNCPTRPMAPVASRGPCRVVGSAVRVTSSEVMVAPWHQRCIGGRPGRGAVHGRHRTGWWQLALVTRWHRFARDRAARCGVGAVLPQRGALGPVRRAGGQPRLATWTTRPGPRTARARPRPSLSATTPLSTSLPRPSTRRPGRVGRLPQASRA